ncbi:hypothetical protein FRC10_009538 [Ceratobasidium sp. 414]|nr:hypothetical protein FRC10_009538 [Ceratobasidium sp. 414]
MWYLSLSLSLATALMAMLVKQWSNAFLSGRLSIPCVQSRIRQARYEKLVRWNTNTIVLFMPIVLHVALVFFMVGLSFYLKGLNNLIFRCVVSVFSLTGLFYAATTLLALFVPFCPFHNALSSILQGGLDYIYWLWFEDPSQDSFWLLDAIRRRLSSKAQEESISNNTIPDALTGHALRWLITSSGCSESADSAIKSVASITSSSTMKALLDAKPIMSLVTQRFTSCFRECAIMGTSAKLCLNDGSGDSVLLYGQALSNLAVHMVYNNPFSEMYGSLLAHEQQIDEGMVEAIHLRFKHLTEYEELPHLAPLGLTGASAWREFVDLSGPSRFDRGSNLSDLVDFIYENKAWDQADPPKIEPLVAYGLFRAMIFEAAHWMHDIDYSTQAKISHSLVEMAKASVPSIRSLLATSLAVMTTTFSNSLLQCHTTPSKALPFSLEKQLRARDMARQYTEREDLRIYDGDGLLLLGLVGLLELHGLQGFRDDSEEIIRLIAGELPTFDILDRREPIRLSADIFPGRFDVRLYPVETLARLLSDEPYLSQDYQLSETARVHLLKALVDKTHIWTSWGDRLIQPIQHMLSHSGNGLLRTQCEAAENAYKVVSQLRQPAGARS